MRLRFTKMQGVGNDFVVFDGVRQSVELDAARVRAIADRHFGVGCDQILLVEPAPDARADFRYRIFNADGGEVEQCGNGARCFVRFVHDHGLTQKRRIRVLTEAGIIEPALEADGMVSVDMGAPQFDPARVPFDSAGLAPVQVGQMTLWPLELGERRVRVAVLSMGNPHAVQVVADVDTAPVGEDGPLIERHRRFTARVNAGFMQVLDRTRIRLRVFERGAGETLACGTGACAAVVAGIRQGLLAPVVRVHTRGGELVIHWPGDGRAVLMTGPAVSVFEGELDLSAISTGTT